MHRDRIDGTRTGSIAIYYRKHHSLTLVIHSDDDDNIEFIGVEIKGTTSER